MEPLRYKNLVYFCGCASETFDDFPTNLPTMNIPYRIFAVLVLAVTYAVGTASTDHQYKKPSSTDDVFFFLGIQVLKRASTEGA